MSRATRVTVERPNPVDITHPLPIETATSGSRGRAALAAFRVEILHARRRSG
jgi:hypothetical protein